ncbi:MAG: iron-containing alcohol dehydrogenase [Sedimentisphaerales bacterium]|nr:iron-containing alcohol dehydrogenase [Sedimentisphaerales bacterium]
MNCQLECQCGQSHHIPIEDFCYAEDSLQKIPQLAKNKNAHKISVMADKRTFEICAKDVICELSQNKHNVQDIIIPDTNGEEPQCDDITCNLLKEQISQNQPQLLIAVGSGTINDLCKWAAFEMNLPYLVVATAASMNGYASANVGAKVNGVKVIIRARPPLAVLAKPAIIENAPAEMTAAGFADTIAKFQSTADWVINNLLFDEYFCHYCANILEGLQVHYLKQPQKLRQGDKEAIKALFEALFLTGAAMTMIGTSAPASGGEHLLSHTLDMTANIDNQGHWLHGLQVGLGTIVSAELYQMIGEIDKPKLHDMPDNIDQKYWREDLLIKTVDRQYKGKKEYLPQIKEKISNQAVFEQIQQIASQRSKAPGQIKDWLRKAGAAVSYKELGCSRQRLKRAMLHMHEMRSRFTVVDLAWLVGILPNAADYIIDKWLTD